MLGMGPWHQRVDVLGEVTVGDADEEVAQVSIRLDAIHFAPCHRKNQPSLPIRTSLWTFPVCISPLISAHKYFKCLYFGNH